MSRHRIAGRDEGYHIDLGWDTGLATFWAQVWGPVADDKKDPRPCLWVGTTPQALVTVDALVARLAPYGDVSAALRVQLAADEQTAQPPSPLQRALWPLIAKAARG